MYEHKSEFESKVESKVESKAESKPKSKVESKAESKVESNGCQPRFMAELFIETARTISNGRKIARIAPISTIF